MPLSDRFHRLRVRLSDRWNAWRLRRSDPMRPRASRWRWVRALLVLVVAAVLGMAVAMGIRSKIDDDLAFAPASVPNGGSQMVAMVAALMAREVDRNGWTPNDPFFLPGHWIDNMPNFQRGILDACARIATEMAEYLGRARGSSEIDPDLSQASSMFRSPPDIWIFNWRVSMLPTSSAEANYREGIKALGRYNDKLAAGRGTFDRRADNMISALERIASDLGNTAAILSERIDSHSGDWWDFHADDTFYRAKGKVYAYAMILQALGRDFEQVLQTRDVGQVYGQMLTALRTGARVDPLIVLNGAPDSVSRPNHLAVLGFETLRARVQMREVTGVLER